MSMRIDQATRPAGTPGQARRDGVVGQEVTLVDTTPGGQTYFQLMRVPDADTTAVASLAVTPSDDHQWTFLPDAEGPYRIFHRHTTVSGVVTEETRIFGIEDINGNVGPCPGERAASNVSMANATDPAIIAKCERNWPTARWPLGNPWGWSEDVGSGGGGGSSAWDVVMLTDEDDGRILDPETAYSLEGGGKLLVLNLFMPDWALSRGKGLSINNQAQYCEIYLRPSTAVDFDVVVNNDSGVVAFGPAADPVVIEVFTSYVLRATRQVIGGDPFLNLWEMTANKADTRRSLDVDHIAILEPLPPYVVSAAADSGAPMELTEDPIAGALFVDGLEMSVFATIAVMWGADQGVYRMTQQGDGIVPWKLRAIQNSSSRIAGSAVEAFVQGGNHGQGRRFHLGGGGVANLEIGLPRFYPGGAIVAPGGAIWPGWYYCIDNSAGDVFMTLGSINDIAQDGMRFGIVLTAADGGFDVSIDLSGTSTEIQDPDTGAVQSAITIINPARGDRYFWVFDPVGSAWRLAP